MNRTEYDPTEQIGKGLTIIEASAGTGKTFTIEGIVTRLVAEARLVAEEGLPLGKILVVTFTRAAAAELKDRVRKRMRYTLRAIQAHLASDKVDEDDDHLRVLLDANKGELEDRRYRLEKALTSFDQAQISTIHSFAMGLIRNLGFRSRLPVFTSPSSVDNRLIRRAAGDLIVARFAGGQVGEDEADRFGISQEDLVKIGSVSSDMPAATIFPELGQVEDTNRIRVEMAHKIKELVSQRTRATRKITYDDPLIEARELLSDNEIRKEVQDLLERCYKVALVDEAQDTDQIQWEVIKAIFHEQRLVVVGDPKQAIYAFRGADIESYMATVEDGKEIRELNKNWRSDGNLIKALDRLLADASFGDKRISYKKVLPGNPPSRIEGVSSSLQIRRFPEEYPKELIERTKNERKFKVPALRTAVSVDVASEIVRLLNSDVKLKNENGEGNCPLKPGNIAVLCKTNDQVDMVRRELYIRKVPSVAVRSKGIFSSQAAEEWRRFLYAVERPKRIDYVHRGIVTPLAGVPLDQADALPETEILGWQKKFSDWRELLAKDGVPSLLEDVERKTGLTKRVLAEPDGERLLTDILHIAEELHTANRQRRSRSLRVWLEAAIGEAAPTKFTDTEDPRQIRLETDSDAVQVYTIHGAKGLEFPVVLAPYLWDLKPFENPKYPLVFHESAPVLDGKPRRRLIDVSKPINEKIKDVVTKEENAENSRKFYVALTRAKHLLIIWRVDPNQLHRPGPNKLQEMLDQNSSRIAEADVIEQIDIKPPSKECYNPQTDEDYQQLEVAQFSQPLDDTWKRVSFSNLKKEYTSPGRGGANEQADDEEDEAHADSLPSSSYGNMPLAARDLPRGDKFGTWLHKLFERMSFDADAREVRAEMGMLPRHKWGAFDSQQDSEQVERFVEGIVLVMQTPLGPDDDALALRDIEPARLRKEMSFELPLRAESPAIQLVNIAQVALDGLSDDDPHRPYFENLLDSKSSRPFRGWMTGGIDLVACLPKTGRYVVMDFKSNTLSPPGEEPEHAHYAAQPLVEAMHKGHYPLQMLLYQVALHRYLKWRLDGYRPEEHLGGSIDLFIRGMTGPDTPVLDGERCGVTRWSPPPEAIVAVSRLFAGEEQ